MTESATNGGGIRRGRTCPLCDAAAATLERLRFSPKPDLPAEIEFRFCNRCNFVFACDLDATSYRRYYASVRNDGGHVVESDAPDSDSSLQVARLADALPADFDGAVLDFGCGQGRLLAALARRFPRATMFGHDVADYLPQTSPARFVDDHELDRSKYDVVILTHVLEHLVEFSVLDRIGGLLAPGGLVYIEVPNPAEYAECTRREFMYYFDRLHINHFSGAAMRRALAAHGFGIVRRGAHRFLYRDGHYPAAYWIASPAAAAAEGAGDVAERPLDAVYRDYRASEARRAAAIRQRIAAAAGARGVLVYGAGDNFRRARWPDGPLAGISLLAVLDRNAARMAPEDELRFATPAAALERFPNAPVVIAVSQGSEAIAATLRAARPARPVLFV